MNKDTGQPLPKFEEWDVNDPALVEGFTMNFNKARDEKKCGNIHGSNSPTKDDVALKQGGMANKPNIN
ncbi:unnamed protein product [Victoria cruziana]